ncbi:MAG: hypothetical protein Q9M25_08825 [Mariprofundaceae bacterium]|nr:hypothetical protein [Mariprofundaceae bacterium]
MSYPYAKRMLVLPMFMLVAGLFCQPAQAATDSIEILHLPLNEAASAARSQLSETGKLAEIPSRRLLIITDDASHLNKARKLLKQLDVAVAQLLIRIDISELTTWKNRGVRAKSSPLPGGWLHLDAENSARKTTKQQKFSLRTTSGRAAHIEAGEIRSSRRAIRQYLARYGVVEKNSVALVEITTGFDVQATLLADDKVRLNIRPWFKRMQQNTGYSGNMELLSDAGSTSATAQPPSNTAPLRFNMQADSTIREKIFYVSDAQTEITAKLGEIITLVSASGSANEFATAFTAYHALQQQRDMLIRLHISHIR